MKILWILLSLGMSLQAHAITPESHLRGDDNLVELRSNNWPQEYRADSGEDLTNLVPQFNREYQIGGEWGRQPVTEADLDSDANFRRMALATAKVRSGGTGFYLGKFNGYYMMASNHHVCPDEHACMGRNGIQFPLLGEVTQVSEFFGTWPEIDLSMFAIRLTDTQAEKLKEVASPFAFDSGIKHGDLLVTIGFGIAENRRGVLMANRDSDCKVYSQDGEFRLMADPDDLNPGTYKAWSFANGCDVSHGDSGSAMMNRDSGEVVGIIWTGRIPKNPKVQNASFMSKLFENPTEDVWKELSYSVPAVKMKVFLTDLMRGDDLTAEQKKAVREMISRK